LEIVGTSDNPPEYLTISSERQHKFAKASNDLGDGPSEA
jgi:hypothetical protein